jgi:hypothetical protein
MLHKMFIQTQMVSSHPFSVLSLFLLAVLEISRRMQMCSTVDLPHSTPFPLWWEWMADYGVDYEIK